MTHQNPHQLGEIKPYKEEGMKVEHIQTINHVSIDDIKKELMDQAKGDFEFSPLEYIPGPDEKKQSVFLKIANIMGELGRVPKSGYNKAHDYHYVTESDVVGAVRPLLAKEKMVMMPSIKSYRESELKTKYSTMNMGTIEIEWILRDAESYEQVKFTMIGKGADSQEKDIYKSISGNKKYALISLFMIDSGDDPERNDSDPQPNKNAQNGPQGNNNQNRNNQSRNTQTSQNGANQSNQQPPKVKQPTKTDILTRWVTLAGEGEDKKEVRKKFDEWYKKKQGENWDHLTMIQVLTKKLAENNQKDKEKEAAASEDQPASEENKTEGDPGEKKE
ncbi:ERF superfamily protein [Bacillus phage vB_BpsM-61]|nr:ERF superfamily protein [Bacillus phage vB_BpsM-61]